MKKLAKLSMSLVMILPTLLFTHTATGGTLRCKSKVVKTGDSQYRFLRTCGQPAFVQKKVVYLTSKLSSTYSDSNRYHTHDEPSNDNQKHQVTVNFQQQNYAKAQSGTQYKTKKHGKYREDEISHEHEQAIQIENWTYDFGPNRLVRKVRFVDGIAVTIRNGGYGFSR